MSDPKDRRTVDDDIDLAAERLMQAEPSSGFDRALMQRLRTAGAPSGDPVALWGGRAAIAALVLLAAVAVRFGHLAPPRASEASLRSVASVDLGDFEPLPRLTVRRTQVASEIDLDGFEPVSKMTLTRWREGKEGRP
jgi:hypothetical protein